jgi:hypothetical protein
MGIPSGENSVNQIFEAVYGQAETVIGSLHDMQREDPEKGITPANLPGLPLILAGAHTGHSNSSPEELDFDIVHFQLFQYTQGVLSVMKWRSEQEGGMNHRISGYRRNAAKPDLVMHRRPSGLIECRVDELSLQADTPAQRVVKHAMLDGDLLADRLPPTAKRRLQMVRQGLEGNIAAVELVRDGNAADQVFRALLDEA